MDFLHSDFLMKFYRDKSEPLCSRRLRNNFSPILAIPLFIFINSFECNIIFENYLKIVINNNCLIHMV